MKYPVRITKTIMITSHPEEYASVNVCDAVLDESMLEINDDGRMRDIKLSPAGAKWFEKQFAMKYEEYEYCVSDIELDAELAAARMTVEYLEKLHAFCSDTETEDKYMVHRL